MLKRFFTPESVAVIGASKHPGKLGFKILKNVIDGGYKGKIYPINPSAEEEILNLKTYKTISEVPTPPDLAIIVIPAKLVPDVAEDCGKKGVKGLIVISAGFKEAGEDGKQREEALKEIVKKYHMRMIGPNCLGIIDVINNLNASFAFDMPTKGKISFITQSGALGTAVLDWAAKEDIGLSKFVSFGNMADVSETDLIEEFGEDPDTRVILLYMEGLQNGRKFIETARKVAMKKPIIMVKAGKSTAGRKAVSSHTGSLAGSDNAYNAALKQAGVIRANSVQELFDYAMAFSSQPVPQGRRVAIVTNAGGPAVMATDAVEVEGLYHAVISERTKASLREFLSPAANVNNPVDILGDALADTYGKAMELVLSEDNVDAIVAILTPQVITQIPESAEKISETTKGHKKPVVASFMGGKRMEEGIKVLMKNGIPNYPFPERAVSSIRAMVNYKEWNEKKKGDLPALKIHKDRVQKIIINIKDAERKTAGDIEGREILSSYGIKVVESFIAKNISECKNYFKKVRGPVVMKLVSPDILHKTEAGGVKVGIDSIKAAETAFKEIIEAARRYKKDAVIEGVQIQPLIAGGTEVIVGVNKDPQFGHLLMFGLGGIYVEILKDVSFRVIPITDVDAEEMIGEIKTVRMLKGFRNIPERDINAVKDVLLRVSQLCVDFPEIEEMDINPLMVLEKGKGAIAVDVRFSFTI
ncbi:MAG: acetate--CoA ligase [Candidatus Ratteibacteria bacterium]|nr:acetate--CoA ligase [Candidatus Ratteibacteria bacterium]